MADDRITVSFVGDAALVARLDALPEKVRVALEKKANALALKLEARIKAKLSNNVLKVQSGNLRASIHSDVESTSTSITGKVASSGDVKYAGIHEFGGRTGAHDILPRKAEALAFVVGGKPTFAKVVHHPGSTMPARSFLRSSLTEMKQEILDGLRQAAKEAAGEALKR